MKRYDEKIDSIQYLVSARASHLQCADIAEAYSSGFHAGSCIVVDIQFSAAEQSARVITWRSTYIWRRRGIGRDVPHLYRTAARSMNLFQQSCHDTFDIIIENPKICETQCRSLQRCMRPPLNGLSILTLELSRIGRSVDDNEKGVVSPITPRNSSVRPGRELQPHSCHLPIKTYSKCLI
jgi:hypothetical protein